VPITFGYDSQDTLVANALNNLASVYQALGDYVHAEPLLIRLLAITEDNVPPDDPEVATALNNLAHRCSAG